MTEQAIPENRWQTIQTIWQGNQWLFAVIGYLVGVLTFPALQGLVTDLAGLLSGFVPVAVGVGMTVLLIERLNQHREDRRLEHELKVRLLKEVTSTEKGIAGNAIREMDDHGWLEGEHGLLKGAYLMNAHLIGVDLISANLEEARLDFANLEGAILWNAKLMDACLYNANLTNATLLNANLHNADLQFTNLAGANLWGVNLAGATSADTMFNFSEKTVLPDAKEIGRNEYGSPIYDKYWTPTTDMTRYTNPNHPDFWQPAWAKRQNRGE